MAHIVMSVMSDSLTEQCERLGFVATGTDLAMSDRLADAVSLCYVRGVLTASETDRARKRIIKDMKLRQVRPAKVEGAAS